MDRNFPLIVSSGYVILERDGKICLTRRINTGYMDGLYALPAGHKEAGEYPMECVIRETKEEVGINIISKDLELVHIMHRLIPDHERSDFFFTTSKWSGKVANMEPKKCDDVSWFSIDDLPENTVPYIRQALEQYQAGHNYSEFREDT